jgi:delta 1-pyrroline-5-carboxylate dehydrogenase
VLVTCTEWTSALALSGQVTAALACGNPVILHATAEVEWCERFVALLHQVGVPRAVLAMSTQETLEQLLALPELTLVAPVCRQSELLGLQRKLAQRDGLLVQLAPEIDPVGCTTLLQPDHMHRFVTEKTRTINTTAVGGNATLLELGGTA